MVTARVGLAVVHDPFHDLRPCGVAGQDLGRAHARRERRRRGPARSGRDRHRPHDSPSASSWGWILVHPQVKLPAEALGRGAVLVPAPGEVACASEREHECHGGEDDGRAPDQRTQRAANRREPYAEGQTAPQVRGPGPHGLEALLDGVEPEAPQPDRKRRDTGNAEGQGHRPEVHQAAETRDLLPPGRWSLPQIWLDKPVREVLQSQGDSLVERNELLLEPEYVEFNVISVAILVELHQRIARRDVRVAVRLLATPCLLEQSRILAQPVLPIRNLGLRDLREGIDQILPATPLAQDLHDEGAVLDPQRILIIRNCLVEVAPQKTEAAVLLGGARERNRTLDRSEQGGNQLNDGVHEELQSGSRASLETGLN